MLFNLCAAAPQPESPSEPHSIDTSYFRSCTDDGSWGENVTTLITEAMAGETITIATNLSSSDPWELQTSSGNAVAKTLINSYAIEEPGFPPMPPAIYYVYEFTMPDDDVVVAFV